MDVARFSRFRQALREFLQMEYFNAGRNKGAPRRNDLPKDDAQTGRTLCDAADT